MKRDMRRERPTRAVEDCVKAVYVLAERGFDIGTSSLADHLEVSPSSVSTMLTRLSASGFIEHRRYGDVGLTPAGLRLALGVIRRRRLIEVHLVEHLGFGWDEVEEEAETLEHFVSDRFVERIAATLSDPRVDPHGDPIPDADGGIDLPPSQLLCELRPGQSGRLVRAWNGNPRVLAYLDEHAITLGERIAVLAHEPFGGSIVVRVGEPAADRVHGFGLGLAEALSVEVDG